MYYVENELKKLLRVKTICAPLLHTRGSLTKLISHMPLLWSDLKPVHINNECWKQYKTRSTGLLKMVKRAKMRSFQK
jgi:hypothetical protein